LKERPWQAWFSSLAGATDGIDWIHELCNALDVATLLEFGIMEAHFPEMIAGAKRASSMKENPVE